MENKHKQWNRRCKVKDVRIGEEKTGKVWEVGRKLCRKEMQ